MSPLRRILVVVDDDDLRQILVEQLQTHEEFIAEGAAAGCAAVERTKEYHFDIILILVFTYHDNDFIISSK